MGQRVKVQYSIYSILFRIRSETIRIRDKKKQGPDVPLKKSLNKFVQYLNLIDLQQQMLMAANFYMDPCRGPIKSNVKEIFLKFYCGSDQKNHYTCTGRDLVQAQAMFLNRINFLMPHRTISNKYCKLYTVRHIYYIFVKVVVSLKKNTILTILYFDFSLSFSWL